MAGDFNGDGCDTVSLYRPSLGRFFVINELGSADGGLGRADMDYLFGNLGDVPFAGDFDGDGVDTFGLYRTGTGLVYLRNSHTLGNADAAFIFGNPQDRFVAGDWNANGIDAPGVLRPSTQSIYVRYANSAGVADATMSLPSSAMLPIAGFVGDLP